STMLSRAFRSAVADIGPTLAAFVKRFPSAAPDVAMQYMAAIRKAKGGAHPVNASRPPAELLQDLISTHMENVATGACASYMRGLLKRRMSMSSSALARETSAFVESTVSHDTFDLIFNLLLRRKVNLTERRILQTLGTIQIHHGSAGSNMV